MATFADIRAEQGLGQLSMFDRIIFKGPRIGLYPEGAFARFLSRQGVLLKDFGDYVQGATARVKAQAHALAEQAGRPYRYLEAATTQASGTSKEDLARAIAAQEGVQEGLICVLAVLERSSSFAVRGHRETQRQEVVRRPCKCLHFYCYYLDPGFGFLQVRLQSWFPFQVQVYIHGREWLARQMDQRGLSYARYGNGFVG
jgi:hypothetical protein